MKPAGPPTSASATNGKPPPRRRRRRPSPSRRAPPAATPDGRRRRRRGGPGASPSKSSTPRPSCASWRRNSPTRKPGRALAAPNAPKLATPRRNRRLPIWSSGGRRPKPKPRRLAERPIEANQRAPGRRQGDVSDLHLFRFRVGGAELGPLEDRPQDDPHLVFGEGGADAAPHAAAE